jgi:hypothetical protein
MFWWHVVPRRRSDVWKKRARVRPCDIAFAPFLSRGLPALAEFVRKRHQVRSEIGQKLKAALAYLRKSDTSVGVIGDQESHHFF